MTLSVRFVLAALLLAACHKAPAAIPPPTPPPESAEPYVLVRDVASGIILTYGPSAATLPQLATAPPGEYVVTALTDASFASQVMSLPKDHVQLELNTTCTRVTVTIDGDEAVSLPFAFYSSEGKPDIYALLVDRDRHASACLPPGSYLGSIDEERVLTLPVLLNIGTSPLAIAVNAYSTSDIDSPPPLGTRLAAAEVAPLAAFPDSVEVIGHGEPDHGGLDYLRSRTSFLIEGARAGRIAAVALEAGAAETIPFDDYVSGDSVDVRAATSALGYWIWDTEEFLKSLEEIRAHNKSGRGNQIRIYGVDVQHTQAAVDFLQKHSASLHLSDEDVALLGALRERHGAGYAQLDGGQQAKLRRALKALASSGGGVGRTIGVRGPYLARALLSRCDAVAATGQARYIAREKGMAELVTMLAASYRGRIVDYWAHNGHVARTNAGGIPSAGQLIGEQLGDKYRAIGVFAVSGVTRAWDARSEKGVDPVTLPPTPPHFFESAMMNAAGSLGPLTIDLRRLPVALKTWLETPRRARDFGAVYPGDSAAWRLFPFSRSFDIAIVLHDVKPTTPTPTGVRRAKVPD